MKDTNVPVERWEKEFDVNFGIFSTNVNKNPLTSKVLKSFIHQAIEEAVEAERKRIEEAVRKINTDCKCRYEGETVCCHEDCKECESLKVFLAIINPKD